MRPPFPPNLDLQDVLLPPSSREYCAIVELTTLKMAANVKVCEHYLKGYCRFGSNCKFTHVENSSSYLRKGIGNLKLYFFNYVLICVQTVALLWQIKVEMFVRSICVEIANTVADASLNTLVPPMEEVGKSCCVSWSCARCEYCH